MRIDDSDIPPNERFGLVFALIFMGLGGYWLFTGWMLSAICALALGLVIGLLTKFHPSSLRKPNLAWAMLGIVLGKVVGTIVMGLIFLTIITRRVPTGRPAFQARNRAVTRCCKQRWHGGHRS